MLQKLQIANDVKVLTFNLVDSNECFITTVDSTRQSIQLGTYSVKTGEVVCEYTESKPRYFDIIRVSIGWCNGDKYAAVSNGSKFLYIQNLFQPHIYNQ